MKKFLVLGFVLFGFSGIQAQLNAYKYFIVKKQYPGFYKANQYRTSTLIKYLLTEEGYPSVYDDELPRELVDNPCLGLWVNLIDESGLLSTKLSLEMENCKGDVVIASPQIRTKEKDLNQAYHQAISEAFGSFVGLNYSYKPNEKSNGVILSFSNDVKQLPQENAKTSDEVLEVGDFTNNPNKLVAIKSEDGYTLRSANGTEVYKLRKTSAESIFLVSMDGKNGLIYKEAGQWYLEFDEKGGQREELDIYFPGKE